MATVTLHSADNTTQRTTTTAAAATASLLSGSTVASGNNTFAIASIVGLNASVTVLCLCSLVLCLSFVAHRLLGRREQRDKICEIITSRYWSNEDEILRVVHTMRKMQDAVLFRDVNAYHILSYKFRGNSDVYSGAPPSRPADTSLLRTVPDSIDIFATMKKIEHLFDALVIQLPLVGRCPRRVVDTFGSTVSGLAQVTSLMWGGHKALLVRRLVDYFAGNEAADAFERSLVGDRELETMILSKIPYVGQLFLNLEHFVLKDVVILNETKLELKAKIRYIDTILSRNGRILALKEQALIESYYAARDICLRNNIIQNRAHFPDMVSREGEQGKVGECVICLRHLVRLMCYGTNMKKMESDDDFYQFVMRLHEVLYSWIDAQAMLEVIERSRNRIISYLQSITVEQILANREFTKAKLEQIEKDLCPIEILQPEREPEPRPQRGAERTEKTERLISVGIEEPTSSLVLKFAEVSPARVALGETGLLLQQGIMEHGSVVSGSSLYVTAGSISPTSETALFEAAKTASPFPQERVETLEASEAEGEYFETPV